VAKNYAAPPLKVGRGQLLSSPLKHTYVLTFVEVSLNTSNGSPILALNCVQLSSPLNNVAYNHGENDLVVSTKRFVNIASAN